MWRIFGNAASLACCPLAQRETAPPPKQFSTPLSQKTKPKESFSGKGRKRVIVPLPLQECKATQNKASLWHICPGSRRHSLDAVGPPNPKGNSPLGAKGRPGPWSRMSTETPEPLTPKDPSCRWNRTTVQGFAVHRIATMLYSQRLPLCSQKAKKGSLCSQRAIAKGEPSNQFGTTSFNPTTKSTYERRDLNPHGLLPLPPQGSAYTNSATFAWDPKISQKPNQIPGPKPEGWK